MRGVPSFLIPSSVIVEDKSLRGILNPAPSTNDNKTFEGTQQ